MLCAPSSDYSPRFFWHGWLQINTAFLPSPSLLSPLSFGEGSGVGFIFYS